MMAAIEHRGPDDSGQFCDDTVALGFQRLSIIDTEGGHQPLLNEDGSIILLANGEIYNYRELRKELEAKGHQFRTHSDCEVIVHLYEEYGEDFFQYLNGMYGISLYDTKTKTLIVGRDRIGIKPMYLMQQDKVLLFGSEIKGILAAKECTPIREKNTLREYLLYRYLSGDRTFFQGIRKLMPGSYIKVTATGLTHHYHWKPSLDLKGQSDQSWIAEINALLKESVKRQMVSDVPLGTLLSGGVDSGVVSAISAKEQQGIHAFTVGFKEAGFNEADLAAKVAEENDMQHHVKSFSPEEFAQTLPKVLWFNDEPLTHANSVQIYLICKYARQHVKVLLTGEGADELFGGYPRYYMAKLGYLFASLGPIGRLAGALLGLVPGRKLSKLANMLGLSKEQLVTNNSRFVAPDDVEQLFVNPETEDHRARLKAQVCNDQDSMLDNLLIFEMQSYMQPILSRQDKMSMAASMESRVPILDNVVMDLALKIPASTKIKRFQPKDLLKKVAVDHIPNENIYGKKQGFGVPVGQWMREQEQMKTYLTDIVDFNWQEEGVDAKVVERLVHEHQSGARDHGDLLWPLVNYVLWTKVFFT